MLAALLGVGCASSYRESVLEALKSEQDALRAHPGFEASGVAGRDQLWGMPRSLIEERLGPMSPCVVCVPVARGFEWGTFDRRELPNAAHAVLPPTEVVVATPMKSCT